jgi:cytochrome c oxidase cbb3-type subunit 3
MSAGKEYKPDTVLDHEFDGIQEYDNRLPNWWLWTLWATIVFSLVYWLVFHTYGVAKLPIAAYVQEMESSGGSLADLKEMESSGGSLADLSLRGLTAADLEAFATDPAKLAEGEQVWLKTCQVCHKATGEGLVGPNLTDDYWVHGGDAISIHNTVVHGVVEKGMAAWGRQLGADRVDAVVAYVLTLRGTHVEGKAPEGDYWVPEVTGTGPEEEAAPAEEETIAAES